MNKIVKKGTKQLKMKEKVAKQKQIGKWKDKDKNRSKTQLKTMVGIYNAAKTGAILLV